MKTLNRFSIIFLLLAFLFGTTVSLAPQSASNAQTPDASPPDHPVKLIFIHHSTGENWLADGYGDLGRTLGQNNYFVSDTNYGWGPEAIGDRTDIPNWTEWFSSPNTPTFMQALFTEAEQHASYTRTLADPGGENEIVMFKSCFPNSALEGNPDDPPGSFEEFSVSGAKYVYNTILQYFATRPDKLFIVITAPPLSDSTYAKNARAFNNWLVNDWLAENNYPFNNVAVFDFFNVLTSPDAHHWFKSGQIERLLTGRNTLYYPSEDDHPSIEGSRKATEEFVPLLNFFYHRWQETAPRQILATPFDSTLATSAPEAGSQKEPLPESPTEAPPVEPLAVSPAVTGVIDDFDSAPQPWEAFYDEAVPTTLTCEVNAGAGRAGNALVLNFNIEVNSWGTCVLFFDSPQNWSASGGITFYFRSAQAGTLFDVDLYAGPAENRETYLYTVEAPPESVADWVPLTLRWADFRRASWEENAGAPFDKSNEVTGIAFGFGSLADAPNTGMIWVDALALASTLSLLGEESPLVEPTEIAPPLATPTLTENPPAQTPEATKPASRSLLPCASALFLPLAMVIFSVWKKKR
jgi:hypothetical protein